jgi:hypothetical protein
MKKFGRKCAILVTEPKSRMRTVDSDGSDEPAETYVGASAVFPVDVEGGAR